MLAEITGIEIGVTVVTFVVMTMCGIIIYFAKRGISSVDRIGGDVGELRTDVKILGNDMRRVVKRQDKDSEKINKNRDVLISEGLMKPEGAEG